MGTDLGDGWVLTAAHVVDGDLRRLTVDDRPAEVVALSAQLDLALLAVDGAPADPPASLPTAVLAPDPGPVSVLGLDGPTATTIDAVVTLRVRDVTEGVRHERPALRLVGAVESGRSGSPVVDRRGHLVGVVVLTDATGDVTWATRPPVELTELGELGERDGRRGCSDG